MYILFNCKPPSLAFLLCMSGTGDTCMLCQPPQSRGVSLCLWVQIASSLIISITDRRRPMLMLLAGANCRLRLLGSLRSSVVYVCCSGFQLRLWVQVSLLFCIGRHTAVNVLRIGSGVPDCLCAVLRLSTARWHGAVDELGIRYRTRRRGKQIRYKFAVKYVFFPRSLWQPGLWSCGVEKNQLTGSALLTLQKIV